MDRAMERIVDRKTSDRYDPLQKARAWLMPVMAAMTAAMGSYLGVIRAIDDLNAEVRVVQTECRGLGERLTALETSLPRDVAAQHDVAASRDAFEQAVRLWMERHEQAYHTRRER